MSDELYSVLPFVAGGSVLVALLLVLFSSEFGKVVVKSRSAAPTGSSFRERASKDEQTIA